MGRIADLANADDCNEGAIQRAKSGTKNSDSVSVKNSPCTKNPQRSHGFGDTIRDYEENC